MIFGEFQAPPHAARKRADERISKLQQFDGLEQPVDQFPSPLRRHAVELRVNQHVFLGGQLRVGRERLRDYSEHVAHTVRVGSYVVTADARRAGGGRRERRHDADQRCLPCPVRSEQAENFLPRHVKAHVVDRGEVAELLHHVVDLNRVRSRRVLGCIP